MQSHKGFFVAHVNNILFVWGVLCCVVASKTVKTSIFVYQNFCCRKLSVDEKIRHFPGQNDLAFISQLEVTDFTLQKKGPCFGSRNSLGFLCQNTCLPFRTPQRPWRRSNGTSSNDRRSPERVGDVSLPKTSSEFAPENRQRAPKGNEKVFQPSIFRDVPVSFREGYLEDQLMTCKSPKDRVKWPGLLPQSPPK